MWRRGPAISDDGIVIAAQHPALEAPGLAAVMHGDDGVVIECDGAGVLTALVKLVHGFAPGMTVVIAEHESLAIAPKGHDQSAIGEANERSRLLR